MNPNQTRLAAIVAAVRKLAADRPDFVYKPEGVTIEQVGNVEIRNRQYSGQCVYAETDKDGKLTGSCIVGQAAILSGIPATEIAGSLSNAGAVFAQLAWHSDLTDEGRLDWLNLVQSWQDRGYPWGYAVDQADLFNRPPSRFDSLISQPTMSLQPV